VVQRLLPGKTDAGPTEVLMTVNLKSSFARRLMGAAMLDVGTYEEIEADEGATAQALVVVVLSSVAAGIGALGLGGQNIGAFVLATIVALLAWAAWALVIFEVGVRLMPQSTTKSSVLELMRTIGFASAPGLLRVVGAVPGTTVAIYGVTAIWMLAAMVVGVRQALDYDSTIRAVIVCAIGWALAIAIAVAFGTVFGPAVY
jgi:hypothetical protein